MQHNLTSISRRLGHFIIELLWIGYRIIGHQHQQRGGGGQQAQHYMNMIPKLLEVTA